MTPAARLSAAITVLDRILGGEPTEQALTNWGRASRFAGSGDRHAVRDLVFDALRCKRSFAALGGGLTGRGLILGGLRASGGDVMALFSGEGHAPARVFEAEAGRVPVGAEALDVQDWIYDKFFISLGNECDKSLEALRHRAPVFLRVNRAKASLAVAMSALSEDGIVCQPIEWVENGLEVTENARKIHQSSAYIQGLVELQDAASQAVVEALPLRDGQRVLDLCAGGGGKTLAMAARARLELYAHDADPGRMRDLPARAARAGVRVSLVKNPEKTAPYAVIVTDVPCSGSGSWRRDPMGKWALTPDRLAALCQLQREILARAVPMLGQSGVLAYVTCSMLQEENEAQISKFLDENKAFICLFQRRFSPLQGGDGFFLALLSREI
jgi:16S rRNA (cytosine967-C5)-methyltransferase